MLAALIGGMFGAFLTVRMLNRADADQSYLAKNRAELERMVFEDLERYGVDIYRLYLEISQALPGLPGSDFAVDKAVKKLSVTYPDSNVRRIADAYVVYGAIRKRDMIQIERYLEEAEKDGRRKRFMPNGFEIEPQLIVAQYNYYFHTGRFSEAEKCLDYLHAQFGGSFIFEPQGKPVAVADFITGQRRVLEIVMRKDVK